MKRMMIPLLALFLSLSTYANSQMNKAPKVGKIETVIDTVITVKGLLKCEMVTQWTGYTESSLVPSVTLTTDEIKSDHFEITQLSSGAFGLLSLVADTLSSCNSVQEVLDSADGQGRSKVQIRRTIEIRKHKDLYLWEIVTLTFPNGVMVSAWNQKKL